MKRSYCEIYIHCVWTTKYKEAMIKESIFEYIHKIIMEKCKKYSLELIALGGTEDHIHVLLSINPQIKISEVIAEIKGTASYFINHNTKDTLYWQDGYGVISISKPALEKVKHYVLTQKEHHSEKNGTRLELEKTHTE
ncbi:MAG: IS200/IS605 family transposase [Clostridia bacterium]|nr:IS200/IS605 family transposase [Clostridia bacterium]